jgi:hypothetical protein
MVTEALRGIGFGKPGIRLPITSQVWLALTVAVTREPAGAVAYPAGVTVGWTAAETQ